MRKALVALGYAAVLTAAILAPLTLWLLIPVLVSASLACGLILRAWWAPMLAFLAVPLSVGSDTGDAGSGVAFGLFFVAIPAALVVAVGVVAGRILRPRAETP